MSIFRYSPCAQTDFGRGPHWLHESPFLPFLWESTQDVGAPSLKHAAMKKALEDQSALTPELFAHVPWHIALYLWECLGRCDKQTLYMWKIMIERYPDQFRSLSPHYRLITRSPKEPLKCYIDLMNSDVGNWRAVLAISTANASTSDLVAIGNMKNLVALDIYPPTSKPSLEDIEQGKGIGLEDRIVRSWLEVAEAAGSLQQLRILRLYTQPGLTTKALWMLEKLPNLQEVVVSTCAAFDEVFQRPNTPKAGVRLGGWIARKVNPPHGDQEGQAQAKNDHFHLIDAYKDSLDTDRKDSDQVKSPPRLGSDIPILEFRLSPNYLGPWYDPSRVIHLTRAPQQKEKKRELPQPDTPRGHGKRVMKDRGGRDMADVLSDFF